MLRVEVDMFSGRPNPEWIITDADVVKDLLGTLAASRGALARPGRGYLDLGFREIRLTRMSDDPDGRRVSPPTSLWLAWPRKTSSHRASWHAA